MNLKFGLYGFQLKKRQISLEKGYKQQLGADKGDVLQYVAGLQEVHWGIDQRVGDLVEDWVVTQSSGVSILQGLLSQVQVVVQVQFSRV